MSNVAYARLQYGNSFSQGFKTHQGKDAYHEDKLERSTKKGKEEKIKEHDRRHGIKDFIEFRAKIKVPNNRTSYTSEVLARQTREEK